MSIKSIQTESVSRNYQKIDRRKIETSTLEREGFSTYSPWVRNPTWLDLPAVPKTEEKFTGLVAIEKFDSLVSFYVNTQHPTTFIDSGTIRVDWGDGTIEEFDDTSYRVGATYDPNIEHRYDYSALPDTTGPVTFISSSNSVSRANHGYSDGMIISFAVINTVSSLNEEKNYYVINSTSNSFQLSDTENGSAINIDVDGSGSILGYKQVIITVTVINSIFANFYPYRHPLCTTADYSITNWLDISASLPNAYGVNFSYSYATGSSKLERVRAYLGNALSINNICRECYNLEEVELDLGNCTASMTYAFYEAYNLKKLTLTNTSGLTNIQHMCNQCNNLQEVYIQNTENIYDFESSFSSCYSLEKVDFDFSSASNMNNAFASCFNLKTIPPITGRVVRCSGLFSSCYSLETAPFINIDHVTEAFNMFANCYSLKKIPVLNFKNCSTISTMLYYCPSLTEAEIYAPNAHEVQQLFEFCHNLKKVKLYAPSARNCYDLFNGCYVLEDLTLTLSDSIYDMRFMFQSCTKLKKIPYFNTSEVVAAEAAFNACFSLEELFDLDLSKNRNYRNLFLNCASLKKAPQVKMNTTAADTYSVSQMYYGCRSLTEIPYFNTSKASSVYGLFAYCYSLQKIGELDLSSALDGTYLFQYCYPLEYAPVINSNSLTSITEMFRDCVSIKESPAIDYSNLSAIPSIPFYANYSLITFKGYNIEKTFSLQYSKLDANAIDDVFTNALVDLSGQASQTITVTNTPGASTCTPSIATAKNWTVIT